MLAFQPHRYTRTRDLFEDFVKVLSTVDALVLTEVYPAGEAPIVAADGRALARALRVAGKVEPVFVENVADVPQAIRADRAGRRRRDHDGRRLDRQRAGNCRRARMNMIEPRHFAGLRGTLTRDAPLARYTSWRAGGPADVAVRPGRPRRSRRVPAPAADLEPLTVLGLGSNLLVRDGGVRGTVVLLHNPGGALAVADGLIYAEAGVASPKLARFAARHDCAGAEFLAGIPGTVGGALAMNAGCYGGETWRTSPTSRCSCATAPSSCARRRTTRSATAA